MTCTFNALPHFSSPPHQPSALLPCSPEPIQNMGNKAYIPPKERVSAYNEESDINTRFQRLSEDLRNFRFPLNQAILDMLPGPDDRILCTVKAGAEGLKLTMLTAQVTADGSCVVSAGPLVAQFPWAFTSHPTTASSILGPMLAGISANFNRRGYYKHAWVGAVRTPEPMGYIDVSLVPKSDCKRVDADCLVGEYVACLCSNEQPICCRDIPSI